MFIQQRDARVGRKKAVVLVSGGLDSATVLAIARQQDYELHAISFDYGQRHRFELDAAEAVCRANSVFEHVVFRLDTSIFRGSALTSDIAVPHNGLMKRLREGFPLPMYRLEIHFSFNRAGYAESIGATDLFIGVNAIDYSGYPDCRPEFVKAFEEMANLATKAGVEGQRFRVHTPLISLTKADIIRKGLSLGVDYGLTHSCYDPAPDGARVESVIPVGCVLRF